MGLFCTQTSRPCTNQNINCYSSVCYCLASSPAECITGSYLWQFTLRDKFKTNIDLCFIPAAGMYLSHGRKYVFNRFKSYSVISPLRDATVKWFRLSTSSIFNGCQDWFWGRFLLNSAPAEERRLHAHLHYRLATGKYSWVKNVHFK